LFDFDFDFFVFGWLAGMVVDANGEPAASS
jgi:hypothetical protein